VPLLSARHPCKRSSCAAGRSWRMAPGFTAVETHPRRRCRAQPRGRSQTCRLMLWSRRQPRVGCSAWWGCLVGGGMSASEHTIETPTAPLRTAQQANSQGKTNSPRAKGKRAQGPRTEPGGEGQHGRRPKSAPGVTGTSPFRKAARTSRGSLNHEPPRSSLLLCSMLRSRSGSGCSKAAPAIGAASALRFPPNKPRGR
jgi:hypothetical protein